MIFGLHYRKGNEEHDEQVRATYDEIQPGGKLQVIPYVATVELLNILTMKFPAEGRPDYCPTVAGLHLLEFARG